MPKPKKLTCFKAYDIRGVLGEELNPAIAYRIARATAEFLQAKTIVVGADMRLSSEPLKQAVIKGLIASAVAVIDIGMTGSEEVYFATSNLQADGGIEITASHNPINYNGMKLVSKNSQPISSDSGLQTICELAEANNFKPITQQGNYIKQSNLHAYVQHLLSFIDINKLQPMRLMVNAGNGVAGHVIDAIENKFNKKQVPIEFIKINHQADGTFPNGIPNPLLPERRQDSIAAVKKYQADIGIAWDADFDRCFFFDEGGSFIESYYIVGLLAASFLQQDATAKIIHDPRLSWNTQDIVNTYGGKALVSKTGHSFIKAKMRAENAIYAGEMSGHHYFRDFFYCDSGMLPWLLIIQLLSIKKTTLSQLVKQRINKYPASGEINFALTNPDMAIANIVNKYEKFALEVNHIDGVSMEFTNWRFNLRKSNTESLLRLNIEARNSTTIMQQKTQELLASLQVE